MVWYVLFGALGAFGLVCALWVLAGYWLLPMGRGTCLTARPDTLDEAEGCARYFHWLAGMGLYRGRLRLDVSALPPGARLALAARRPGPEVELYAGEMPRSREKETELGGSGAGDDPGDGGLCDLSEL